MKRNLRLNFFLQLLNSYSFLIDFLSAEKLLYNLFVSHTLVVDVVMGSILGPNRVTATNVKRCNYYCYVRCATFIVFVG